MSLDELVLIVAYTVIQIGVVFLAIHAKNIVLRSFEKPRR